MSSDARLQAATDRDPVEQLAEEFLERYRRGERPALSEFIVRAPDHADDIRELFPALVVMEQAVPVVARTAGPGASVAPFERLGEYRIIREVGRGGMGVVYEAEQEALSRQVALKVLPREGARDGHCLLRFRREARAAARLHHTNIVPVFDIGEHDGVHYYAMQLIHGQALDDVITEVRRLRGNQASPADAAPASAASLASGMLANAFQGDLPPAPPSDRQQAGTAGATATTPQNPLAEPKKSGGSSVLTNTSDFSTGSDYHYYRSVAQLGLQVASALSHAHGQRVLHRDIKPSNLLLDARGSVWLTDFGLAKEEGDDLTRTGDVVGTLRYMAPERFTGAADARSDIYGLGLTLYEMLALRPAFLETDRAHLVQAIATQEPRPPRHFDPKVPRDLETIVLKAINKDPAGRYAAAVDMEEDLRRFLSDRPIQARRTSTWERVRRWCRRNSGWAATIAVVVGLLFVMALVGTIMSFRLQRALHDLQSADQVKTEKLWQSHLDRARARRSSGRIGQRFETLSALREAAQIKVTAELRDEAAAALVLPDVEIEREWEAFPEGTLAVAPDATLQRYVRMSSQGELTVCRLTGKGEEVIIRLPIHGQPPFLGLGMSPDGRFVAYGHSCVNSRTSGGVRVWRLDGAAPSVYTDTKGVRDFAVAFSADGQRLALGHADGTIGLHDLNREGLAGELPIGETPSSLAFDPRDGHLAAACAKSIRLFDGTTGKELPPLRHPGVTQWAYGLAWHPQGRLLAATAINDLRIYLWDTETGAEYLPPLVGHTSPGIHMAFNRAGDRLVSVGWDQQTRLWDPVTGRLLLTMSGNCGTQFSADGTLIGFGGNGAKLQLWRVAEGRELRVLRRQTSDNSDLLLSPVLDAEGRILAAHSQDGLSFFDLLSGQGLASVHLTKRDSAFPRSYETRDGWMTGGAAGVLLWPRTQDLVRPNHVRIGPPTLLSPLTHAGPGASKDGRVRALPYGKEVLVLDRDRPGKRVTLGPLFDVRNAAVSPDGRWVATFSWWWDVRFESVKIWEADTGRHVLDLPAERETNGAFSPDGRWLAVSNADQCQLWEVGVWRPGKRFDKTAFCWNADGTLFMINDVLGVIRFVDPATGAEKVRIAGPDSTWYSPGSLCLTPDGTKLVARAADSRGLYVWDLRLVRQQLNAMGMDWEIAPFPAAPAAQPALTVEVDAGDLR